MPPSSPKRCTATCENFMRQYFTAGRPRVGLSHRREFEIGDQLPLAQGDFWLISRGQVQLEVTIGEISRSVGVYGPGQLVGLNLAQDNLKLVATALIPTEACGVKSSIFVKYASNNESKNNAATAFATQLHESYFSLWLISSRSVKARLAGFLLQLAKNIGFLKEDKLVITVSRKTLAYNIGTAYETVSRFLTILELEGCIQRVGSKIFILNREKLYQVSHEN